MRKHKPHPEFKSRMLTCGISKTKHTLEYSKVQSRYEEGDRYAGLTPITKIIILNNPHNPRPKAL